MRTFIAIDLSYENKAALAKLQDDLKQSGADVKWVQPENIHLTLKFLGEVTDEYAGRVKEALDKAAAGLTPFELSLSGVGAFPKPDYPRVIWVGVDKGGKEIGRLAENVEDELEKIGFAREQRPFAAHLTIGRVRSGKNKEILVAAVKNIVGAAPTIQLVSQLILYQSKLTPQGPVYTPLYTAKLS